MSRLPKKADVVILGGGVMGTSTAYHLVKRGQTNILLLERESFFGTGATGRCAGGIRHQFNTEVNIRLSQKSLAMIDALEEETGQSAMVRKCGYLFVLTDEKDVPVFQKTLKLQDSLGVKTEWLSGDEVSRLAAPCVFPDAIGGTFNPDDGLADPNSIVMGYIKAARRQGAVCLTDCTVTDFELENNKVRKVRTSLGSVETETVVNACGPWSTFLGNLIDLEIPQLERSFLLLPKEKSYPSRSLQHVHNARALYLFAVALLLLDVFSLSLSLRFLLNLFSASQAPTAICT